MLLNHSTLGLFDELQQHLDIFPTIRLGSQFFQSLRSIELRCQQNLVSVVDLANSVFAESAALQANRIQPIRASIAGSRSLGKGKNIAGNRGPASDKGIRANADEMVHRAERANRGPLFDRDVPAESRGVGKNHVIADRAIVGDVRVRHHQNVTTHASQSAALYSAAIDGNELTNLVAVADFQASGFAGVGQILRRHSDRAKWKKGIMGANFRWPFDGHVRNQATRFSEFNIGPDHTVRTNFATRVNSGAGNEKE